MLSSWGMGDLTISLNIMRLNNIKYSNPLALIFTLWPPDPNGKVFNPPQGPTAKYWHYIYPCSLPEQAKSDFNHCCNYT